LGVPIETGFMAGSYHARLISPGYDAGMRVLLVISLFVVACGATADTAVDQYINKDFAPTHAKIIAARQAYADVNATDVDERGKLEYLRFRIAQVAAPFLAQALEESKKLAPPAAAKTFHDYTISVLTDEAPALAKMAAALSPVDAGAFKAAHARMMEIQARVFTWEEFRTRMLTGAHVELGTLPRVAIPEARATVPAAGP
jgi:hypothetical protein